MWLKPQGYAVITDPVDGVQEFDSMTCAHCNRVEHVKAGVRPEDIGGFCSDCAKIICRFCVNKPCDPLEEKLKRQEARYHALRSYGV